MPRLRERRKNSAQRHAIERTLAGVAGTASVVRAGDGSVFVYDERRDWSPPITLRVRITPGGDVEPPDRLRLG